MEKQETSSIGDREKNISGWRTEDVNDNSKIGQG